MSEYPRGLHPLHRFEKDGRYYVADLLACYGSEVDKLTWDILGLYESHSELSEEEIVQQLEGQYSRKEIIDALSAISSLIAEKLLLQENDGYPKILFSGNPLHSPFGGLLESLKNEANLFFTYPGYGEHQDKFVLSPWQDTFSLIRFNQSSFSGTLLQDPSQLRVLTLLEHIDVPVFVPIWSASQREEVLYEISLWYSAMRDFDAFLVPNEAVRKFYSEIFLDESLFQILPPGVDCQRFCPLDKKAAKHRIAELMLDSRLEERPIVGFVGVLSPERGASLYLRLAEAHSEFLFLVVAPHMGSFYERRIPDNLVLYDFYSDDDLPLIFNALDIACFFSIVQERLDFYSLLQTMACGVVPIAFAVNGVDEIVGEAGVLIEVPKKQEQMDIAELFADISVKLEHYFLNDTLQQTLSVCVRQQACRFSWDTISKTFIQLLTERNVKMALQRKHPDPNFLTCILPYVKESEKETASALVLNQTTCGQSPLDTEQVSLGVLEGLTLTLLRQHNLREVESILKGVGYSLAHIRPLLQRVGAFLHRFT